MLKFPTTSSGLISGDPHGRTYAELDHWYQQHGTSLYQQCCMLAGFLTSAAEKKAILLALAKTGAERPSATTKDPYERQLGNAWYSYTTKKRGTYDVTFCREVRQVRPDWFLNTAARKKKELLALAEAGATKSRAASGAQQRSKQSTGGGQVLAERKLARALYCYTDPRGSNYDPDFDKLIRSLRADWFSHA